MSTAPVMLMSSMDSWTHSYTRLLGKRAKPCCSCLLVVVAADDDKPWASSADLISNKRPPCCCCSALPVRSPAVCCAGCHLVSSCAMPRPYGKALGVNTRPSVAKGNCPASASSRSRLQLLQCLCCHIVVWLEQQHEPVTCCWWCLLLLAPTSYIHFGSELI